MARSSARVVIPGSQRKPLFGARVAGGVCSEERFEVTVRVRRRAPLEGLASPDVLPAARHYLTREEYARRHGSSERDLARVKSFARAHGLAVTGSSSARRSVFLAGTAVQFEAAFGTRIRHYEGLGCSYRGRTGSITVPAELAGIVTGVFGLDDRPAAVPHFQRYRPIEPGIVRAHAAGVSYDGQQLAKLYDFPAGADGAGQCIGIIELGGGYRGEDLSEYFRGLGLAAPQITAVRVDGATNQPGDAQGPDGEVMLDIEVAGAVAPRARIAVYFAPNTDKGFLDAVTLAIHDTDNRPSVISISWGGPEKSWTRQAMDSFDAAFQAAAQMGVTICCAAGDAGSGDENPEQVAQIGSKADELAHVDFPGSSPHALCCGGTRLVASGGKIASETVWNEDPHRSATGGGVSDAFPLPVWQRDAGVPPSANPGHRKGRGVPDVAGDADPATGYRVRVDGEEAVIGGTSAVAPLWAGLIALCNQKLGAPAGFIQPLLYADRGRALRDIVKGDNGAYAAKAGWDACTGWGSPDGARVLAVLQGGDKPARPARRRSKNVE